MRYFTPGNVTKTLLMVVSVNLLSCGGHDGVSQAVEHQDQILTADSGLKVLFFGDSGKGNAEQRATATAMTQHCAKFGCDFGLMLGDNIYPDGVTSVDDPQFQTKFEEPLRDLDLKFNVILGNHDMHSGPAGMRAQIEYSKISKKWSMPARYYSFTEGNVEFFALDTNTYRKDQEQIKWLANSLANSQARWRVVLGHHPIYSVGDHGYLDFLEGKSQKKLRNALEPILCKHKALYLSGHEHLIQVNQLPCGITTVVAGAAAERKAPYQDKIASQKDTLRYYSTNELGFGYATFTDEAIRLSFVNEKSEVLYNYEIN